MKLAKSISLRSRTASTTEDAEPTPGQGEAPTRTMVERARSGDMSAWARLYQDHFDGLFRHLRYLCGDSVMAEELVQETFVQALSAVARFDGRSSFSTWLHGIGLNIVRGHWRSQRSTQRAHAKLSAVQDISGPGRETEVPDQAVLVQQRVRALYAVLEQLPEQQRAAFVLRELEGLRPPNWA